MRLRKWTSLGNWAERQKTISTPSARLRKNPDIVPTGICATPKQQVQNAATIAPY